MTRGDLSVAQVMRIVDEIQGRDDARAARNQERARAEAADVVRDIRVGYRSDVAGLGDRPSRWRPVARSRWMTRRLEINVEWIHIAIDAFSSDPLRLASSAFRALMDELSETEEIVDAKFPEARVLR
jgi:hypothetical protein